MSSGEIRRDGMRISVIGAGPAGLYLAILMKQGDPANQITVFERNPSDATFGWGVVFSEETLGALREADEPSYTEISESFAKWDAIEIYHGGELIRSRGHAFSAISRKVLLSILQNRCLDLGVDLRFETEIDDPTQLAKHCDLLVAGDGINSVTRSRYEELLGSTFEPHGTRFAWFGADLAFDAFTFIFSQTEHGLFQVHAYPFDATTSTFIVECSEDTWRRAGLDSLSEKEAMAYCESLFAAQLNGHRLLSNRSVWTRFVTLSNQSWHHENIVLVGDAAHTAHFTIGSGTKLAMEDSIALADALGSHTDTQAALVDYEMRRQPTVERFQEAARQSARYFEHVPRYAHFDPLQFSFNLLTRSGRIGYTNLTLRDHKFIRTLDGWFARPEGSAQPPPIAPPPMFTSFRCFGLELENRVVKAPMGESAHNGLPTKPDADRLIEATNTGAGLVLTPSVAVSSEARITSESPTIADANTEHRWAEICEAIHRCSSTQIALRLVHAGRRGASQPRTRGVDLPLHSGGWPLFCASPIAYTPQSPVPKAMDYEDMQKVISDFARSTERAMRAGFDMLELDLAHGYLLASFLSPLTNHREDEYGQTPPNRMRFPLEVVAAVREVWPSKRLLAARVSASDLAPRGATQTDMVEVCLALARAGCALIHVEAGQTVYNSKPTYGRSFLADFSDRIRSEANVATLVGGHITTTDEVNTIIGAGRADLCILDEYDDGLSVRPASRDSSAR
jgi:anthraniloyl-CoA monooxygenase